MTVKSTGRRPSFIGAVPTCFWAPSISILRKATLAFFISAISFCSNRLDQPEPISGTVAAAVLQRAQKAGLKTILDLVSEDGDRFTQIVRPALKFCDYCVLNEFEAERTTGIEIVREGRVDFDRRPQSSAGIARCRCARMDCHPFSCRCNRRRFQRAGVGSSLHLVEEFG